MFLLFQVSCLLFVGFVTIHFIRGYFPLVDALLPSQQLFSHVWTIFWVEQVLGSENKTYFSRKHAFVEAQTLFSMTLTFLSIGQAFSVKF